MEVDWVSWIFVTLLLVTDTTCIGQQTTNTSQCANRCLIYHDEDFDCQCNERCPEFRDCCPDFMDECSTAFANSCKNRCLVGYIASLPCQCNDRCGEFHNCCKDFDSAVCPDIHSGREIENEDDEEGCGDNSHYDLDSDACTVVCQCNDGYGGTPPNCQVNMCASTCHEDAECSRDSADNTFCQCSDGYGGNGNSCVEFECDPPCKENEFCDQRRSGRLTIKFCRCKDGFRNSTTNTCTSKGTTLPVPKVATTTDEHLTSVSPALMSTGQAEGSTRAISGHPTAESSATRPSNDDDEYYLSPSTPGDVGDSSSLVIASSAGSGVVVLCLVALLFCCVFISRKKKSSKTQTIRTEGQGTEESIYNPAYQSVEIDGKTTAQNVDEQSNEGEEIVYNPAYQSVDTHPKDVQEKHVQNLPNEDRTSFVNDIYDGTDRNSKYGETHDGINEEYSYVEGVGFNSGQKSKVTDDGSYDSPIGEVTKGQNPGGRSPLVTVKGHAYAEVQNDEITRSTFTANDVNTVNKDKNDEDSAYNVAYESSDDFGERSKDDVTYNTPDGEIIDKESSRGQNDEDLVYNVAYESSGPRDDPRKTDGEAATYYYVDDGNSKQKEGKDQRSGGRGVSRGNDGDAATYYYVDDGTCTQNGGKVRSSSANVYESV